MLAAVGLMLLGILVVGGSRILTVAYYDFSSGKEGLDVNLRHTFKSSTGWIAAYHQGDGFDQARIGYEYDYRGDWLTVKEYLCLLLPKCHPSRSPVERAD